MTDVELTNWLKDRRPINWNEMGSSAKDLWEEHQTRAFHAHRQQRQQQQQEQQERQRAECMKNHPSNRET